MNSAKSAYATHVKNCPNCHVYLPRVYAWKDNTFILSSFSPTKTRQYTNRQLNQHLKKTCLGQILLTVIAYDLVADYADLVMWQPKIHYNY